MQFRVLGPVEVVDDEGRAVALGGARQRALLAALLLHANEVAPLDRLIDELWGENPPATGSKALQVAVSHLRKSLGDGILETRPNGYLLRVEPDQLDAARFELLRESGRFALGAGRPDEASRALREALSLWRGPAFADVADELFARADAERLEELRLLALEERIGAELELGRHADLVPELEALVARYPLRERLREHLMLALYGSGRQAEALEVYRATRRMLADELGIEPGRRLQELERAILTHDPALDLPPVPPLPGVVSRRGGRTAVAAAAALAAVVAVAITVAVGRDSPVDVRPNSVAVIDPERNAVVASIPVGVAPGPMAAGAGFVWVLNRNSRTLSQIDPQSRRVVSTSGLTQVPNALGVGEFVYVLDGRDERLYQLDPRFKEFHDSVLVDPTGRAQAGADLAVWGGEIWVTDEAPASVVRVRLDLFGTEVDRIALPGSPSAVAAEAERVWVALDDGRLVLVDRRTLAVERTLEAGRSATAVAVGAGGVWVADGAEGTVIRAQPRPFRFVTRIKVGNDPGGVAVGAGSVWVANRRDGTISRIDTGTNSVTATIGLGRRPHEVVVAGGLIWVSVR